MPTPQIAKSNNENLRQRNKDDAQRAALYWNQLSNDRLFEITKQLLGIAFVILPLSGSLLLINTVIPSSYLKILIAGWTLLFISIGSGFWNLWVEANYFNYLSNDSSTRESIWSDTGRTFDEMNNSVKKLGTTKPFSSMKPLFFQALFLMLGIIAIMFVIGSLLLQTNESKKRMENRLPYNNRNELYFRKWHE